MFPETLLGSKRATFFFTLTVLVTTTAQVLTVPLVTLFDGRAQWGLSLSEPAMVALLVVGCAIQSTALAFADRRPALAVVIATLTYLILGIGLAVPSWLTGMYLVIALTLFLLATRAPLITSMLWAVGVVSLSMTVMYLWLLVAERSPHVVIGYVLGETAQFAAPVIGATALGIWWRARVRRVRRTWEEAELAKREHAQRVSEAQEAERVRLAHELHDVAGQHLAGLTMLADAALAMASTRPDDTLRLIAEVRAEGRFAAASLAGVLADLRAAGAELGEPSTGLQRTSELVDYWRRVGMPVEIDVSGDVGDLPPVVSSTAYQALQEALTNAAKHAPGATVAIRIGIVDASLDLTVESQGRSVSSESPAGIGLGWGIEKARERVELLHGTLVAGVTATGGWCVRLVIPQHSMEGEAV